jgi:EpsI family protein
MSIPSRWFSALVCATAGVVVFQFFGNATRGYIDTPSVFWWWGVQWFDPASETQHGPLMVALAAWLFWRNLRSAGCGVRNADWVAGERMGCGTAEAGRAGDDLSSGQSDASAPQLIAMLSAFALHALGYLVQQTRLSIVALLLFTWGVLRMVGGERWGRAAAFPLGLLLFAIPAGFLETLGFHLRLGVIAVTEWLARAAGIEVIRSGTQLFAPDGSYQYDVAAACSGVRSLMALLALSLVIGYTQLRSWPRRLTIFALALPLTFVGNVVRIAAIVFAGEWFGQAAGEWLHHWAGFVVFVIVLGGVQIAASMWARREGARPQEAVPTSPVPAASGSAHPGNFGWPVGAVLLIAALTAWGTMQADRWAAGTEAGVALTATGEPAPLPAFLGTDWIGQAVEVTVIEREILPPDTGYARRNYVSTHDRRHQVFLSVVLSGKDRTSIHRPELCLVGQGWTILGRSAVGFTHPEGGEVPATVLHLNRETVGRGGERRSVPAVLVYWFVGRDTLAATTGERLWRTALNRLRLRPDRWAYVVAQTLVLPNEGQEAALERIQQVLDGTLPAFQPAARRGR